MTYKLTTAEEWREEEMLLGIWITDKTRDFQRESTKQAIDRLIRKIQNDALEAAASICDKRRKELCKHLDYDSNDERVNTVNASLEAGIIDLREVAIAIRKMIPK